jgi:hypothetical protein
MEDQIKNVLTSLVESFDKEITDKSQNELEGYWFFKWDDSRSIDKNIYEFTKMLDLYKSHCREWEESHNGICCVVEKVRDTYLMPKIKEFRETLERKLKETSL